MAVTLHYLPRAVMDFFGSGEDYGVELTYVVEEETVGTAGSVKLCGDFLGEEDFLVVSGDAVTDLDLTQLLDRHRQGGGAATLALCRREDPLAYGLVRADREGRILGFVEKPGWGQVDTELVNTGIYVLSRRAMDRVPDGADYDFGKDLFPALLADGEDLRGYEIPGYWQDMGDCPAYLESLRDALDGKVKLDLAAGRGEIPPGVEAHPTCWVGRRVSLARGSILGPYTVVGEGSTVETGALVERSVLLGAHVGEGAEVRGTILCRNARVHQRAMTAEGVVLGQGASVGREAIVAPGVKLWPDRKIPEGGRAAVSQVTGRGELPRLSGGGVLRGIIGEDLTPELLVDLGAVLGQKGEVGLGWQGGPGAELLGRAAACGVTAAGGTVAAGDALTPAGCAWLGRRHGLPVSLFVSQDGEDASLWLRGPDGLPLDRAEARKLEGALLRGETVRVPAHRIGSPRTLTGAGRDYPADAARRSRLSETPMKPVAVAVDRGEENEPLALALTLLGCQVERGPRRGWPLFALEKGGFALAIWDEEGKALPPDRLLCLLTKIEIERGRGEAALPAWAPVSCETLGGRVLRLGRDGKAALDLWRELPWLWDGTFAACRLCARLGLTGESLSDLIAALPPFQTVRGEVPLRSGRGKVMEAALGQGETQRLGEGVRRKVGEGWVYLVPMSSRQALRVIAEAADMETAQELCGTVTEELRRLDG